MEPAGVRSAYRLLLRAVSASVLHSRRSTFVLRRLYRPLFDSAYPQSHILVDASKPQANRDDAERWLSSWNTQLDATLQMLVSSAQNAGLANRLTRNLSHLSSDLARKDKGRLTRSVVNWNGQWTPEQLTVNMRSARSSLAKRAATQKLARQGLNSLHKVISMAEGTSGVLLGRSIQGSRTGEMIYPCSRPTPSDNL